jgi:hypothetical protein
MIKRFRETTEANALARRFGVFDPTLYGTLVLWLDAADVDGTGTNPSNGTQIISWKDKSGLGKHATKTQSTPVLDSTGVNSKPGIFFSGAETPVAFRGALANTGTVSTTFVVATLNAGTETNGRLVSLAGDTGNDDNSSSFVIPFLRDVNRKGVAGFRNNSALSTKAIPEYDTPFYATSIFDNTNNTVYVNGTAATSVASTGSFAITKYAIGTQATTNGDMWKGYVSEVLIYNSALSTANRQAVESYLATKWSI